MSEPDWALPMNRTELIAELERLRDLLHRWFKYELNDRNVRIETMRTLQAVGKLKGIDQIVDGSAKGESAKRSEP